MAGVERLLTGAPGVLGIHLDGTRAVAHLTIDPQVTSAAALRSALHDAGYGCVCEAAQPDAPAEHRHAPDAHGGHGAHMVRDMLRRFIGSALLTVPIVLHYSPLGTSALAVPACSSGTPRFLRQRLPWTRWSSTRRAGSRKAGRQ